MNGLKRSSDELVMNFRRFTVFLLIKKKSLINYCAIYSRADASTGWRGADKRGPPVSGTGRERGRALVHGPTRQRLKGGHGWQAGPTAPAPRADVPARPGIKPAGRPWQGGGAGMRPPATASARRGRRRTGKKKRREGRGGRPHRRGGNGRRRKTREAAKTGDAEVRTSDGDT